MSNYEDFIEKSISSKGSYSGSVVYMKNDVVTYNNIVYICIANKTTNILPTDTSKWNVLVSPVTPTVQTIGSGTNPSNFTLSVSGSTVILNKGS